MTEGAGKLKPMTLAQGDGREGWGVPTWPISAAAARKRKARVVEQTEPRLSVQPIGSMGVVFFGRRCSNTAQGPRSRSASRRSTKVYSRMVPEAWTKPKRRIKTSPAYGKAKAERQRATFLINSQKSLDRRRAVADRYFCRLVRLQTPRRSLRGHLVRPLQGLSVRRGGVRTVKLIGGLGLLRKPSSPTRPPGARSGQAAERRLDDRQTATAARAFENLQRRGGEQLLRVARRPPKALAEELRGAVDGKAASPTATCVPGSSAT